MDGARLITLAQRGYGMAAARVGLPHDLRRPVAGQALPGPLLGTVLAALDRDASFPFKGASEHGEAVRHAILDGRDVRHGDYLMPDALGAEPLFVAMPGAVHATLCVACNANLRLIRAAPPNAVGLVDYRSTVETTLWDTLPASVLMAGRGGTSVSGDLPGDMPVGEWTILLPRLDGFERPQHADILQDAGGRRLGVKAVELTALGWRVAARTLLAN